MARLKFVSLLLFSLLTVAYLFAGTTGKISGRVTDAKTGEPLPGVNVFLEGTTRGAASDVDGYYYIINVNPGTYTLKATFVGYADHVVKEVIVQSDLTTEVNIKMRPEVMTTEEVVVVAEKPVIQKDVAASQKNISSREIQALPVTTVEEVVGLQAGVTSGLGIRGSESNEALFVIDGISLRDTRNNEPITEVPLSALEEISVQAGGFGAEFNNVRSGVVNVVSKEGESDQYSGVLTVKAKPAQPKHFGISPYDRNSFWMRPYLDPDVMWTGTKSGAWDEYTRRQYPDFDGWHTVSERTLNDDDPNNDLTPEAARRLFLWQHRKQGDIKKSDYNIDGGFGGPVPFISKDLGNLRFYASYKRERNMYLFELATDALSTESYMLRLTSDLTETMKLSLFGLYNETKGTASSRSGGTGMFSSAWGVANAVERVGFTAPWRIYTNTYFSQAKRYSHTLSAKLTNVIGPNTFWEARLIKIGRNYFTGPGSVRDTTKKYEIFDDYYVNEAPFGFEREAVFSVEGRLGMGGAVSVGRDSSTISNIIAEFDFTSQINRHHQIKTGLEFTYEQYDMGFGMVNYFLPEGNTWTSIDQNPFRASVYLQDKIEYEGFIANLGIIADYFNSNGKWFDVNPFNREFFSDSYSPEEEEEFKTEEAESRLTFSPRLAISHPITENSKLFFNYGHYRQMPTSERFYRVQRDIRDKLDFIGNPTIPLAKTVSYELGYDHALFDQYLLRLAAYYKDIKDQEYWVRYISFDGKVNYSKLTNQSYEDIRGFEVDLTKRFGDWITGNVNYEYRVGTAGHFGTARVYENPAEQRQFERQNPEQFKPRPQPRMKSYIDLHTPQKFGPKYGEQRPLSNWHFNFISNWTAGNWFTWNPNNVKGIQYNVQWNDYYNVDLRITKTFPFSNFDLKFFADINNVFNFKHFSGVSFYDNFDYEFYMKSLHLPSEITDELGYGNIPGDDQPGDYRKHGVEYQPMEWVSNINRVNNPNSRAIYYDASTKRFMEYKEGNWAEVSQSRIDEINENKAYIDMPNQTYFTFLNPRNAFFGLTLTYHF